MRRDAYRDVGGRPRLERAVDAYRDVGGRPRLERAVEAVDRACPPVRWPGGQAGREQAVEEARSRPDLPAAGRRGSSPASMQASAQGENTNPPGFKINDLSAQTGWRYSQVIRSCGGASLCHKAPLHQSGLPLLFFPMSDLDNIALVVPPQLNAPLDKPGQQGLRDEFSKARRQRQKTDYIRAKAGG